MTLPRLGKRLNFKRCWIISEGKAGMLSQTRGIAEALGIENIQLKNIPLRRPWCWLTPYFRWGGSLAFKQEGKEALKPPFPELVIACGRQAVMPALWIKRHSSHKTKVIYIQNPVIDPKHFDAVVVPRHDGVIGENVIQTYGAPHRITAALIDQAKTHFQYLRPSSLSGKVIGVLLGGNSRTYRMTEEFIDKFLVLLAQWQEQGYGILISPSRRTPPELLDKLRCSLPSNVYIWDQKSENPYLGILAHADILFITCDSVSMITESCVTTTPIFLLPLLGGGRRITLFHEALLKKGRVRWWDTQRKLKDEDFMPVSPLDEGVMIVKGLTYILTRNM